MSDDALPPADKRRRSCAWRLMVGLVALVAVAASACSSNAGPVADEPSSTVATEQPAAQAQSESAAPNDDEPAVDSVDEQAAAPTESTVEPSPEPTIDESETELPRATIGFEALAAAQEVGPQPVSMKIDDIGVGDAEVIAVGVNEDLSFEVPPADQVGWYRFGPAPGAEGSAVLAAHIAYNGVDGVFRYLADVEPGAIVEIGFDDGTSQRYRIDRIDEYLKGELPDSLWAETGPPQLALITCGGAFNPQLRSYESNVVAIAVPV